MLIQEKIRSYRMGKINTNQASRELNQVSRSCLFLNLIQGQLKGLFLTIYTSIQGQLKGLFLTIYTSIQGQLRGLFLTIYTSIQGQLKGLFLTIYTSIHGQLKGLFLTIFLNLKQRKRQFQGKKMEKGKMGKCYLYLYLREYKKM